MTVVGNVRRDWIGSFPSLLVRDPLTSIWGKGGRKEGKEEGNEESDDDKTPRHVSGQEK